MCMYQASQSKPVLKRMGAASKPSNVRVSEAAILRIDMAHGQCWKGTNPPAQYMFIDLRPRNPMTIEVSYASVQKRVLASARGTGDVWSSNAIATASRSDLVPNRDPGKTYLHADLHCVSQVNLRQQDRKYRQGRRGSLRN